jgi:hypothetical protein
LRHLRPRCLSLSGEGGPKAAFDCYFRFPLRSGACVSADAATLFTDFGVFGFLNNLDAFDATDFDVRSFLAIKFLLF